MNSADIFFKDSKPVKQNNMKHVHFFQYNIPADNQFSELTELYIDVIANWDGKSFYNDGRPMVTVYPVIKSLWDCQKVKDWYKAGRQMEKLAENHFASIAKAERISQARAILFSEGEATGNPILDRYTEAEQSLVLQENL